MKDIKVLWFLATDFVAHSVVHFYGGHFYLMLGLNAYFMADSLSVKFVPLTWLLWVALMFDLPGLLGTRFSTSIFHCVCAPLCRVKVIPLHTHARGVRVTEFFLPIKRGSRMSSHLI